MRIMRFIRILGISVALIGLIIHFVPLASGQTIQQGSTIGSNGGLIAFAAGWALLGASLAFSAGFKYQQKKLEDEKLRPFE